MEKKLYKNPSNKMLCGVCSGLAKYFALDINIIRIIMVLLGLMGPGIIIYIVCALMLPDEPAAEE